MREYVLFQAERAEFSQAFPVLRRLVANWRKRRRLRDLRHLDDHVLADIGVSRADVAAVLSQPLSVDPAWELERRARVHRPRPACRT